MSCRILAPLEHGQVRPLELRELHSPAADAPDLTEVALPPPGPDPAELERLQNRIAELERALPLEVRKAREQAYQEGHNAGRDAAAAEVKPVIERLVRSSVEIAGLRGRIRKDAESDLVALTLAIARRVLRRELSVDPEAIHGVVKAALSKIQSKEINVVRTHPQHVNVLRGYFDKAGLSAGLEIAADATLELGGVVFQTKRGDLDASVETQLKEIERGFTDRLGH